MGLLEDYQHGLGYVKGDTLVPRPEAKIWFAHELDPVEVIVLNQSVLAPHEYEVIGERRDYKQPSLRFLKVTINGHDWMRKPC